MKPICKKLVVLICLVAIGFCLSLSASAQNSDQPDDLVTQVSENLNITLLPQGPKEQVIFCYAVNVKGWFAIGYQHNMVHVYDECGQFQYGFRFRVDGLYALDFKGDNLVIYLNRSDMVAEIDPAGNCVRVEEVDFTNGPLKNVFHPSSTQIGNLTYSLERDIGIFERDYSRLVATDETGNRTILYDVTAMGYFVGIGHYVLVLIFPACAAWLTISKIKREEQNKDQD